MRRLPAVLPPTQIEEEPQHKHKKDHTRDKIHHDIEIRYIIRKIRKSQLRVDFGMSMRTPYYGRALPYLPDSDLKTPTDQMTDDRACQLTLTDQISDST